MPNAAEVTRHVIPVFQNNANITLFQHDNATSHTTRDTVNFLRAINIAFMNDWPAKSSDLNPFEQLSDNLGQRVIHCPIHPLKCHSAKTSLNSGMEQHSTSRNQYTYPFYAPTMQGSPSC